MGSGDESGSGSKLAKGEDYIDKNVYGVFSQGKHHKDADVLQPIEDILTGKTMEDVKEQCMDNR
jgi:hypothetical protein